jgi:hypothetical protein
MWNLKTILSFIFADNNRTLWFEGIQIF